MKNISQKLSFLLLFLSSGYLTFSQCEMVEYTMDNPLVTKAIYAYYNRITLHDHPLWKALKKDKTKFILLKEEQRKFPNGKAHTEYYATVSSTNFFKTEKVTFSGYFIMNDVLFVVESSSQNTFVAKNKEAKICLDTILRDYTLKEYQPTRRVKRMFHNQEVETVEFGDRLSDSAMYIVLKPQFEGFENKDYALILAIN